MSCTTRSLTAVAVLVALLAAGAQAQMTGKYTIDPNGTGSRNFTDFSNATYQLFVQGVSGPVTFEVASGTYRETWKIAPITGVSATNTVTFKSKTPLGAKLGPTGTNSYTLLIRDYTTNFPVQWIVLDGFEFINTSTSSSSLFAVSAAGSVLDFEVKNCRFRGTRIYAFSTSETYGPDSWSVHHNVFEISGSRGLHLSRTGAFDIHNNQFTLNGASSAIYKTSSYLGTAQRSRIYNNVIAGTPAASGTSYAILADYSCDIDHNTVLLEGSTAVSSYCVYLTGVLGRHVELRNNIFVNETSGPVVGVSSDLKGFDWLSEGNIYYTSNTSSAGLFYSNTTKQVYTSLSSWQQATGKDKTSRVIDPMLVGGVSLPDRLKLQNGSPAVGAAKNTRSWITTDFAGAKRPTPASIGAYEGKPKIPPSTFVAFGKGCAGTFNNVPKIGFTGDLKLGSTNFAVTLANALGGAKATFAVGVSKTRIGSTSLPIMFGGGCSLLTSSDLLLQLTASGSGPGNGTASVKFSIPNNPALKGAKAHFQWGVVDPAAGGIGLAFSDGATVTL